MATLTDQIVGIFESRFTLEEDLTPTTSFEELGLDSLVMLEVAAIVERRFGVAIRERELLEAGSIEGVVTLIEKHRDNP